MGLLKVSSGNKIKKRQQSEAQTRADLWTVLELDQYSKESLQTDYPNDRRRHPRYDIKHECTYRIVQQMGFDSAMLFDISESGLAIDVSRKIAVGRSINILIKDGKSNSLPWLIRATVVRDAGTVRDRFHRYGCRIEFVINPDAYLD